MITHDGDRAVRVMYQRGADRSEHPAGQCTATVRTNHDDRELLGEVAQHGDDRTARRLGLDPQRVTGRRIACDTDSVLDDSPGCFFLPLADLFGQRRADHADR